MSIPNGPTEGGSGGKRGHSNIEHWGFTDEIKEAVRRRLDDKRVITESSNDRDDEQSARRSAR